MKTRIPLQIVDQRLILKAVVECPRLRVRRQIMDFIIDTGSPDSFLSQKDVVKLQIPMKDRPVKGDVNFGGSTYKQVNLPAFTIYLLKEDKGSKDYVKFNVPLTALKTSKTSEKKKQVAYALPSILGIDFLKSQKVSLHVILTEDMAYLQLE